MDALIRVQFDLYGRIARSFENLRKMRTNITIGIIEARLQALETYWVKFEAQHERLTVSHWEHLTDSNYLKRELPSLSEEAYFMQKGLFFDALRSMKNRASEETPAANSSAHHHQPPRTTLPRIQLPQFSGPYEDWPSFRDLFNSLIVKDVSTTQVEKLHYLKTCLKGEAEMLIRNLPTTEENFNRGRA